MFGIVVEIQGRPAGLHSRTEPRGQDEKGAMAGTRVEPSKTNHGEITLDLSAAAGPAAGERQEDDQGRQEDRRTDGGGDGWERGGRDGAGTSAAGALAHLPCCHTNGDTIRVGLKDGGGRFFFLSGGRGVMEGQKRTKRAGSCQGKRDGSGKTGTDLSWGMRGVFFFPPLFSLLRGKPGERGGGR